MSVTYYTDFKAFKVTVREDKLPKTGLFDEDKALVVFGQSHESNIFPRHDNWKILYIGTESGFDEVVNSFKNYARLGSTGYKGSKGSLALHMTQAVASANTANLSDFYQLGHAYISYDMKHIDINAYPVDFYMDTFFEGFEDRAVMQLLENKDLITAIEIALDVKKHMAVTEGLTDYYYGNPWACHNLSKELLKNQ